MNVEKDLRIKLLLYTFMTAVTFFLLAVHENSSAGVTAFIIVQLICVCAAVNEKKRLWFVVPVLILALNFVLSGNHIWRPYNVILSVLLWAGAFTDLRFSSDGQGFIGSCLARATRPFSHFFLPFHWLISMNGENASTIKRILKALLLAIPAALILLAVLSGADMIFARGLGDIFIKIIEAINIITAIKIVLSVAAGLYLFGLLFSAITEPVLRSAPVEKKQADALITGIFLFSILIIYTIFCVIQFRYLFCGARLPYGLSYTDYARRGFFELLALSGVNILLILFAVRRCTSGSGAKITKGLCCWLCAVTFVLLASSFYRMTLYCGSDGLTRLRLFVLGFLIFEALGLAATVLYIFKPVFNIMLIYLGVGLVYYLLLNLVPVDYFVAKSQVDMYLSGQRDEIFYAYSLSSDAAPQLMRLSDDTTQRPYLNEYFNSTVYSSNDPREFNFSQNRARQARVKFFDPSAQ